MSANIVYAIIVTSLATFLSRFLGALTSQGIKETSKLFKWFNCLAYATLAALIACLLYTSPSPRDMRRSRMPSSA